MARLRLSVAALLVAGVVWGVPSGRPGGLSAGPTRLQAGAQAAETVSPVPPGLEGTWRWVGFSSGKERMTIGTPDQYTLEFPAGDRIALKADCNRAAGSVTFGEAGAIKIGPMAMTRAMCPPGSLSDRFAQAVERATHWSIHDGALLLEQPADLGTLRFLHAP